MRNLPPRIDCVAWNTGVATAIGIGVGTALTSSLGPVGYAVGLGAALGTRALARKHRG